MLCIFIILRNQSSSNMSLKPDLRVKSPPVLMRRDKTKASHFYQGLSQFIQRQVLFSFVDFHQGRDEEKGFSLQPHRHNLGPSTLQRNVLHSLPYQTILENVFSQYPWGFLLFFTAVFAVVRYKSLYTIYAWRRNWYNCIILFFFSSFSDGALAFSSNFRSNFSIGG